MMRTLAPLAAALALTAPARSAPPDWSVEGQWAETCNCPAPCPCWEDKKPTPGDCRDLFFFLVEKGHWGATRIDGVAVIQVAVSAPDKTFSKSIADKDLRLVNLYVPASLSPEQLAAVEQIFARLAIAPRDATPKFRLKKVALSAQVTSDAITAAIPGVLQLELRRARDASHQEKPYPLDTSSVPWLGPVTLAEQVRFDFSDDGQAWTLKGRNGSFAPFAWSAKKGPLPGEAPPPSQGGR